MISFFCQIFRRIMLSWRVRKQAEFKPFSCSLLSSITWKGAQTQGMDSPGFDRSQLKITSEHLLISSFSWTYYTIFEQISDWQWKIDVLMKILNNAGNGLVAEYRLSHNPPKGPPCKNSSLLRGWRLHWNPPLCAATRKCNNCCPHLLPTIKAHVDAALMCVCVGGGLPLNHKSVGFHSRSWLGNKYVTCFIPQTSLLVTICFEA